MSWCPVRTRECSASCTLIPTRPAVKFDCDGAVSEQDAVLLRSHEPARLHSRLLRDAGAAHLALSAYPSRFLMMAYFMRIPMCACMQLEPSSLYACATAMRGRRIHASMLSPSQRPTAAHGRSSCPRAGSLSYGAARPPLLPFGMSHAGTHDGGPQRRVQAAVARSSAHRPTVVRTDR